MKIIQITVEDDLHARVKDAAWRKKQTLGDFVRAMLELTVPVVSASERAPENGGAR